MADETARAKQGVEQTVLAYIEAWNAPDEAARRALLERCWAEDGSYADPAVELDGREELSDHIGQFLQGRGPYGLPAGCRLPIASGIDHHHGMIRFRWVVLGPEGSPLARGFDYGQLGSDGRIRRIGGFFGPPAPIPESWPDHLAWREE
jgi:hypothetical protein